MTRSGCAILRELTAEEAHALVAGDVVIVRAPTGYWPLTIERVRASAYGEIETAPCIVVDARVLFLERVLTFAPEELLRVGVAP